MTTVLYIKANIKPEGQSRTFRISDRFMDAYAQNHPDHKIITLDLYKEGIQPLTQEAVSLHKPANPEEWKTHPILKYAHQFANADKYVFAEPLWNLSIPMILKGYIDYVTVTGITFKYTAEGPVGLCQGKKALNITTRGGSYAEGPFAQFEMGDRYLRTICGFLGITNFTTIAAEGLDIIGQDVDGIVNKAIQDALALAEDF